MAGLLGASAIAATEDTQSSQRGSYEPQQGQSAPGQSATSTTEPGQARQGKMGQMGQQQQSEQQKNGTIRSLDLSSKTFALKGGHRMHRNDIAWSKSTEVLRNGQAVGPEALKKGERVTVTVRKEGDRLIAQQIIIQERQQARTGKRAHQER